jgi:hypothetical protein
MTERASADVAGGQAHFSPTELPQRSDSGDGEKGACPRLSHHRARSFSGSCAHSIRDCTVHDDHPPSRRENCGRTLPSPDKSPKKSSLTRRCEPEEAPSARPILTVKSPSWNIGTRAVVPAQESKNKWPNALFLSSDRQTSEILRPVRCTLEKTP